MVDLPLEILIKIALESPAIFGKMLALRPVAEFLWGHRKWVLDKFTIVRTFNNRTEYKIGRKLHREDGPAIIYNNETTYWWKDGLIHRDGDLPAVERADGHKEWWKNGQRHRDGHLPAIIYANGITAYWVDDKYLGRGQIK